MKKVKRSRTRMILTSRTAWCGVSLPRAAMARETAALMPLANPRGIVATLRLAWACARAAWRCASIAARDGAPLLDAESRRVSRETRLRALGFEEPTAEQRKENLALNVALRDWPKI